MIKQLILMGVFSVISMGSPIIDYQSIPEHSSEDSFYIFYLKYSSVHSIIPLLPGVCSDCHWVVDHSLQRIGVNTSEQKWQKMKGQIRALDRKEPMIQLVIDVIEISDIKSEKYQHMLYQLAKPLIVSDKTPIQLDIEYMISSGNADVVSSPRIITRSGQSATISVGDQVPYTTITQHTTSTVKTVDYIDSGIELEVTPYAHYNKRIDLSIQLSYKTVSGYRIDEQSEMPIIASRKTKLAVQIPSSSTVIFAGLLDQSNHKTIEKVPILGDLPIIGGLFSKVKSTKKSTDLIYKITATVIK